MQPRLHVLERLAVSGVIHDDDAVRAAVVAARDRAEALLPRRVPNLQLDRLALQLDRADFEVDADGGDVALRVGVIGKAQQEARLADARVADEHELENVIVFLSHFCQSWWSRERSEG